MGKYSVLRERIWVWGLIKERNEMSFSIISLVQLVYDVDLFRQIYSLELTKKLLLRFIG